MDFFWKKETLRFKKPALTSRNTLTEKNSFIIELHAEGKRGLGECSLIPTLSPEKESAVISLLKSFEENPSRIKNFIEDDESVIRFPALVFALEMATIALKYRHPQLYFPSAFTREEMFIPINGLVWIDDFKGMDRQIDTLLKQSFRSIKVKVGRNWKEEKIWLQKLRAKHPKIEIRLDANGAFSYPETLLILKDLEPLHIHSIEQPIAQGQTDLMRKLCAQTTIPIALDEELIGVKNLETLISYIKPQFLILKPSLIGGLERCERCIDTIKSLNGNWWATSALESNIGLNAIAQWVFCKTNPLLQGLGTGSLFINNLPSPIYRKKSRLYCSIG